MPYILILMMLAVPASFAHVVAVGAAFGVGRSIGPLQAMLGDETQWSEDLDRTKRLIERLGSGLGAVVAVAAALAMFG
jgi:hypothetical protein